MPIQWSEGFNFYNIVELQFGVSQDKPAIYVLIFENEGDRAGMLWFNGNDGKVLDTVAAPDTLAGAQQGFLQQAASMHDQGLDIHRSQDDST